ncbi:hypothetical protein BKA67DRAFT_552733 [Truncatella angustata]|uniref:Uncharacterized protein n=1 Tax=Truncatella angustata TaxID=152316 RepID=A0A9P8UPT4_9PEZI|nr:uncharacterized protein BKA67DRAFT_552733 [Truncatella angustata]KAH6656695.1 hypothetical protein BKA67DRAFT_552733 [Truncatella angustata]
MTRVKCEGAYTSLPNLFIARVPVCIWNLMPKYPSVSFIGYICGANMAATINQGAQQSAPSDFSISVETHEEVIHGKRRREAVRGDPLRPMTKKLQDSDTENAHAKHC